jgi:hypothetical protein
MSRSLNESVNARDAERLLDSGYRLLATDYFIPSPSSLLLPDMR